MGIEPTQCKHFQSEPMDRYNQFSVVQDNQRLKDAKKRFYPRHKILKKYQKTVKNRFQRPTIHKIFTIPTINWVLQKMKINSKKNKFLTTMEETN
jgi:hypothetical protein